MRFIVFILLLASTQIGFSQNEMFDICPLKVGEKIPEVSIKDANGQQASLSSLISSTPTVIIFYRGAWCGYCTKHLSELNDLKEPIADLGYQMIGITVDQSSKLNESNVRSNSEIPVFSDAKLEAIQAFGLDWTVDDVLFDKYIQKYKLDLEAWSGENHHSLSVPAVFIIKDGLVQFQYVNPNYKIRLKPATLLAILETL